MMGLLQPIILMATGAIILYTNTQTYNTCLSDYPYPLSVRLITLFGLLAITSGIIWIIIKLINYLQAREKKCKPTTT